MRTYACLLRGTHTAEAEEAGAEAAEAEAEAEAGVLNMDDDARRRGGALYKFNPVNP
jgi:hypothetical protein